MSLTDPGGRPADCHAACPHYEAVSGTCTHDLRQSLEAEFREHPGLPCPVYEG